MPQGTGAPSNANLALLACAAFFSAAALRVCDPLLPRFAQDFGLSTGGAGDVIIGFSLAYGFLQLAFGPLGDRFGKLQMMTVAVFGCAAAAAAAALSTSFPALVASRIVWGMAGAGVIPLAMAHIGDSVPYNLRQETLARFLTGTLTGMVAGQLMGGFFADSGLGWRSAFLALMAGYLVIGVLLGLQLLPQIRAQLMVPTSYQTPTALLGQLQLVLRTSWARMVLLAVLAEGVFLLSTMAYVPAFLHDRFELALSTASALTALYAVGGLLYAITARHIVFSLGERRMAQYGGWLMGAGFATLCLLPHWGWSGLIAFAIGFGTYLFHNTLQTHATQMVPSARGTAVSLFAFALFTGQALGVMAAGWVIDRWGYIPWFAGVALALPLTGGLFARALRKHIRIEATSS